MIFWGYSPESFFALYAALKRRSSTMAVAFVSASAGCGENAVTGLVIG